MSKSVLAAAGTLAIFAIATASTEDTVTLKRVPTKGEVLSFAMTGSIEVNGGTHEVAGKRVDTTLDVTPDGNIKSKWEEVDITVDGNSQPDQAEGTIVSKPTGELVSTETTDLGRTAALDRVYFPATPVKVGDTWSFEGKKTDKLGTNDFKAELKLIRDEKVGAFDTWKIQEDVKETKETPPATVHETVWIDKKDCSLVKKEMKFTDYPLSSAIPPVNGTINLMRK
jgi:hypothetical protein